jgi:hypothetical protein
VAPLRRSVLLLLPQWPWVTRVTFPQIDSRFLLEDIPTGVMPMLSLARLTGPTCARALDSFLPACSLRQERVRSLTGLLCRAAVHLR